MPQHDDHSATVSPRVRRVVIVVFLIVGTVFATAVMIVALFIAYQENVFSAIVKDHFVGVFTPPIATVNSMILVLVFRVAAGPMEFKALGFEFKGASGPIVLWCLTFLLQIVGVGFLWKV